MKSLKYKGYVAKIEFSSDDNCFHGKIDGISDLVTFESDDITEIESEFYSAVDGYLDFYTLVRKKECLAQCPTGENGNDLHRSNNKIKRNGGKE